MEALLPGVGEMALPVTAPTAAIVLSVCVVLGLLYRFKAAADGIPEVSGGLPILGVALRMIRGAPWDLMSDWATEYGGLYKFFLFGQWCVGVADPVGLEEVMRSKLRCFEKDLGWTYRPFLCLLGTGIVTSGGKHWMKQRALISNPFKVGILTVIPRVAREATRRLADALAAVAAKDAEGVRRSKITLKEGSDEVEMGEEFRRLTLQVIAEAILSLGHEESDQSFAQMYLPIVTEGNLRTWYPHREYNVVSPSWWGHWRNVRALNAYMSKLVRERRQLLREEGAFETPPREPVAASSGGRRRDLLDKIIATIPEDEWNAESVRQLRDELKTFMLAGHETSASMLTWALYELTQNEHCMRRVREEAERAYGKETAGDIDAWEGACPLEAQDPGIAGLEYTEAVLRETLRRYSVVPTVSRVCTKDTTVMGKPVAKGTVMMLVIKAVHDRDDIWPDAKAFKPERFLSSAEDPKPFTFVPFIQGPRNCLGQYLSLLESKIVLSSLVHLFDFSCADPGACGERHQFMLPVIPQTGMYLRAAPRRA